MPESESSRDKATLSDRLHRIFIHAVEAVRCHLVLIEGRLEAWGRKAARRIAVVLAFALALLFGVIYLLSGLAQLVQDLLPQNCPAGVGHLIVGAALVCGGFAVMALFSKSSREKKG